MSNPTIYPYEHGYFHEKARISGLRASSGALMRRSLPGLVFISGSALLGLSIGITVQDPIVAIGGAALCTYLGALIVSALER